MTLCELLKRLKQMEYIHPELIHKEVQVMCDYDAGICLTGGPVVSVDAEADGVRIIGEEQ